MARFSVAGVSIPAPVVDGLLARMKDREFTIATLAPVAKALLQEHGPNVSVTFTVAERLVSREKRQGRVQSLRKKRQGHGYVYGWLHNVA